MEKCALIEALVLISNQFKDYTKQKAFLEELMATVAARWTSDEMRQYVHTHTLYTLNCVYTHTHCRHFLFIFYLTIV